MFIASLIVLAVLSVGYVATGINISYSAFLKPKKLQKDADKAATRNANLKNGKLLYKNKRSILAKEWDEYTRWSSIRSKPSITLKEFDGDFTYVTPSEAEIDAAKAHAYRRLFWSPVWPLMLAGDVYRGYQKAKAGERVYLLEQSTKALEKAMADGPELDKTYEKAKAVLEKATVK